MEHFPLINRLHTDVLEEKYGPISARVIIHDDKIRESHLVDTLGVSRTYAITFFQKTQKKEIEKINNEIKTGVPIGKAFRNQEYSIRKNVISVYLVTLPHWLKKTFGTAENKAKARLSEFYARKGNAEPIIYGTVVEVYSPDFRPAEINTTDKQQVNPVTREFEKIGISKSEVWDRISQKNDWSDIKKKYLAAKKASRDDVYRFKRRIEKIIKK
ncbi:MAG: hypothetical protein KKD18_01715 [Nanoarchaeota archaeon]|nr:hypothetical protein [Nanoarchaeota archaeon]MBU0977111.1 hypothetical protein [Nanoarchaeota archaeon]